MLVRLGCLVCLLSCFAVPPAAAEHPMERATLKGIGAILVIIEEIEADVERAGLSNATLQTDVEVRLRQSGIRVISSSERNTVQGSYANLYVNVNVLHSSNCLSYVYSVRAEVTQPVLLERDHKIFTIASTWRATGSIATAGSARFATTAREEVRDQIDQFINAFLAMNPKR